MVAPDGITCKSPGIRNLSVREPTGQFPTLNELTCEQDGQDVTCVVLASGQMESPRRPPRTRGSRSAEQPSESVGSSDSVGSGGLRIIGRDGGYFVLNREALFAEVARFVWGNSFVPTDVHLQSRGGRITRVGGTEIVLSNDHWRVAEGASPVDLGPALRAIRPEVSRQMDAARELSTPAERMGAARPRWIPQSVWDDTIRRWQANEEGMRLYAGGGPANTDIVMVVRNHGFGGYATAITDPQRLYVLRDVVPPGVMEGITGMSNAQLAIEWLARANVEYNQFMIEHIQRGDSVQEAQQNYHNEVQRRLVTNIMSAISDHVPGRGSIDPALEQALKLWSQIDWWTQRLGE